MTEQSVQSWEWWGPLADRYCEQRPRKILALDGGGIRGMITLGVLKSLEDALRKAHGGTEEFRLAHFFDLIGGTSTGAIIATALATGMSVEKIQGFYREFATTAFARRPLWQRWQSLYGGGRLEQTLKDTFGETTDLSPANLRCLLTVVARNATTDSAWPISSNPFARFNDPALGDCNLQVPLWKLVRASTAAPVYFPPEVIEWDPSDPSKSFVFVDGGTTAYNNPAFLLFKMATEPAYRLGWLTGERDLLVVSVGTGGAAVLGATAQDPGTNLLEAAKNTMSALMSQVSVDQDISCRIVGRCTYGGVLDAEIHDLIPVDPGMPEQALSLETDLGKAFLYVRYNVDLTPNGLTDLEIHGLDAERLRAMDDVANLEDLARVGSALGGRVDLGQLGSFV